MENTQIKGEWSFWLVPALPCLDPFFTFVKSIFSSIYQQSQREIPLQYYWTRKKPCECVLEELLYKTLRSCCLFILNARHVFHSMRGNWQQKSHKNTTHEPVSIKAQAYHMGGYSLADWSLNISLNCAIKCGVFVSPLTAGNVPNSQSQREM